MFIDLVWRLVVGVRNTRGPPAPGRAARTTGVLVRTNAYVLE
jgi:hypothetical protein